MGSLVCEHLCYTIALLVTLIIYIIVIACPYWAISTQTNNLEITSRITIFVGFWQQCESSEYQSVADRCRYYTFSQSALPAYFNFSRWTICISGGLSFLATLLIFISNPCILKPESTSSSTSFSIRILAAIMILIGGGLTVAAGSWFSYTCYTNELGALIGPGTNLGNVDGTTAYTPDWCCVLAIIDGALCVILACVIAGRACCIQFDAEKPTPMIEVEAINEAMKIDESPQIYVGPQAQRAAEWAYQNRVYI